MPKVSFSGILNGLREIRDVKSNSILSKTGLGLWHMISRETKIHSRLQWELAEIMLYMEIGILQLADLFPLT